MSKQVTVEELVANIEQHLDDVKNGEAIDVVESGRTIVEMKPPLSGVRWPDPSRRLQDVDPGPRPKKLVTDPAQLIIDEREYERSGKKHGL
ncbi:MAG TPA: hypothetical protein VMU84_13470 [Thermoanaerobaculia bacterium]|nr:hypothetical protein [Thermoanaerobaculia bacterium]